MKKSKNFDVFLKTLVYLSSMKNKFLKMYFARKWNENCYIAKINANNFEKN